MTAHPIQRVRTFSMPPGKGVRTKYLLYLPDGYGENERQWPLMLFLHGAGERGADIHAVKRHGPPMLVEQGQKLPFILVSPLCPLEDAWSVPVLRALVEKIQSDFAVDSARLYLTGLSMGGNGVWRLAMAIPGKVSALAPVCGWADPAKACLLKDIPTWVFHGKKDRVVPFERSAQMVKALKACGGKVRFTAYPEAGHDSWTETYENPSFFRWLLKQRRSPKPLE